MNKDTYFASKKNVKSKLHTSEVIYLCDVMRHVFFRWLFLLIGIVISIPNGIAFGKVPSNKTVPCSVQKASFVLNELEDGTFGDFVLDLCEEMDDDGDADDFIFIAWNHGIKNLVSFEKAHQAAGGEVQDISKSCKKFIVFRNLRL